MNHKCMSRDTTSFFDENDDNYITVIIKINVRSVVLNDIFVYLGKVK